MSGSSTMSNATMNTAVVTSTTTTAVVTSADEALRVDDAAWPFFTSMPTESRLDRKILSEFENIKEIARVCLMWHQKGGDYGQRVPKVE